MPIPAAFARTWFAVGLAVSLLAPLPLNAVGPRALQPGTLPNDVRLKPLKDLNGYFPFTPPKSKSEWSRRAECVRRQIRVAEGLWPTPTKTSLHAVIHGPIDRPEYTIEKVYFQSAPGFFVTGNLYRPKHIEGKIPGVLFAHGHWKDARLSLDDEATVRREIAAGQERFERGGRSIFQSMCVQLARMGCVVWQWDMLGDSDSIQFSRDLIHGFKKQRPEMNTIQNWGLFSPQAVAHLQSAMGLQTWNSIRSLDFLLGLPEVDPNRIAMTGASGGATQTIILSAIDPRVKLSFPAVMVSTAMQGGCTCENASLLRVGTGNVEFAAMFAPKPLGMTNANDWTKEMPTKGFPELQKLYALLGHPKNVMLARGEQFPHNYNAVSRSAFYTWLNRYFKLGAPEPVIERDYEPLTRNQLTVWDKEHPAPKSDDPDFERRLLHWFAEDARKQILAASQTPDLFRKLAGPAAEILIGRTYATAGDTDWQMTDKFDRGDYLEMTGLVRNTTYREELPVVWLYPKHWNGRVILWLDDSGKSALYAQNSRDPNGSPAAPILQPAIRQLVKSGATVLSADLLYQGEFLPDGKPIKQTRVVANPREAPAYTFGYNYSLFAHRTHDLLTLVRFIHTAKIDSIPSPSSVAVAAFGQAGPIAAAARAVSGNAIDLAAIDTGGFRFAKLLNYRDPQFLPGGAKYLDLPGLLALAAPQPLWLTGEPNVPRVVSNVYQQLGARNALTFFNGDSSQKQAAATKWLRRSSESYEEH
ncbi:MAG TPA: acetylxylan esterase [Lacipirellulaceae bacterium]|nr:acetylxylan esterase [Lacipirellulaceae bacterium]